MKRAAPTAAATPVARAEPTDEQYRLAWRHIRGRYGCPDTMDEARAHPVYGKCLRGLALDMGRPTTPAWLGAARRAAARLGPGTYVPPTPPGMPLPPGRDDGALGPAGLIHQWSTRRRAQHINHGPQRIGAHDAKRAAANDRD